MRSEQEIHSIIKRYDTDIKLYAPYDHEYGELATAIDVLLWVLEDD